VIDRKALLDDLKQQVKAVETDLGKQVKVVSEGAKLRAEYDRARKLGRTAATWNSWLDDRITQVAVAWVLGTVFVRFCEDNGLIPDPYLTAPGEDRRNLALARFEDYVSKSEDPTYRGWLVKAFRELGSGQAGRLLFDDRHNPLFQIPLSHDGARDLVDFWRGRDESGALVHDFTDPLEEDGDGTKGWDTRFLGDLYQDLSEAARKTYALLQTPEFVEEFILDRTMDPAVREFGYEGLKMIDPTCGSGHFVLGAFRRLVRLWGEGRPGKDLHERVAEALDSVHGVDLNPFAVAIARFRLLVAAMAAGRVLTLAEAGRYEWPIHLAVGDSLIKHRQDALFDDSAVLGNADELADFKYDTEDVHEHQGILTTGRYHVVVGNPPYITVKDKKLNDLYRDLYNACAGTYALSVPFAQRFFELAKGGTTSQGPGIVGQITANSFMKREFGTKLIESFFRDRVELTEVIDTSGAYIPGHGTPTVILIGKQRGASERSATILTVRSVSGEPSTPENGEDGLVWKAILDQIDKPGSESKWVSVDNLDRANHFSRRPWVLNAGGIEMVNAISTGSQINLQSIREEIGAGAVTREDDAYMVGEGFLDRNNIPTRYRRPLVQGVDVRDYLITRPVMSLWPYRETDLKPELCEPANRILWPNRTILSRRVAFGKTQRERGLAWFEYSMFFKRRYNRPLSICIPEVASHNHFSLNREAQVFKDTAPVVTLPENSTLEDHLALLAVLNSSTVCLWLKMTSHDKGNRGGERGTGRYAWESFFQFKGNNLETIPLPETYPVAFAIALDEYAQQLSKTAFEALGKHTLHSVPELRKAHAVWDSTRARMIALQEELDWQVYSLYGLHAEDLRVAEDPDSSNIPELALGERAFEIALARQCAAGEASYEWFKRHGSTPTVEIPSHWPAAYREIVQKRIDVIESSRAIAMVERPEYKRRWATEGWDSLQERALKGQLLDRIEDRAHWFDENGMPALITLSRLADNLSRNEQFTSIARIYAPHKELLAVVSELVTDEHVPFLPALRYKPAALKKRADWEHVWDLQRQEDAAPDEPARRRIRDTIPVPPKYTSADFLRTSYWRARGKLDVPKERFISYARSNVATPDLYGWAGWDHREQAIALDTYIATHEGLTTEEVTPLLAGLLELQPWLTQWHNDPDPLFAPTPARFFEGDRQMEQGKHGLTDDDLRSWRPAAATRGRRATKK
jgi:hypothetical protein